MSTHIQVPTDGERITANPDHSLNVPERPIIPYIEGDGIGVDITPAMCKVLEAAVSQAYGDDRGLAWMEIFAGEKATREYGGDTWLPEETLEAIEHYKVAIKGPLTTPVGEGFRSINVSLRQRLDLYLCLRPVRYYDGTPSPLKRPEETDMVIFRENSEDIYAGIEWEAQSEEARRVIDFLQTEMGVSSIRFPESSAIGVKPISREGTQRLVRKAIQYALDQGRDSVTLVHKGNIMKYTEGAFKTWGYELAQEEFGAEPLDGGPWQVIHHHGRDVVVKDAIADAFLQQILLRPKDFDVIATMNLNGDYISDALAAQVGGIGMAPGANLSDTVALFEATHGTAPKYAGQDMVNPASLILSGEMLLRHLGWNEAADRVVAGLAGAISSKRVTYDLARLLGGATKLKCSEFADAIIDNMA